MQLPAACARKPMSLEALSLAKFSFQDPIQSLPNFHLFQPQRDISVFYGCTEVQARVSSMAKDTEILFAAMRRRAAAAVVRGRSGRWRPGTLGVPWRV